MEGVVLMELLVLPQQPLALVVCPSTPCAITSVRPFPLPSPTLEAQLIWFVLDRAVSQSESEKSHGHGSSGGTFLVSPPPSPASAFLLSL
jgi:hypothetical protein